MQPIASSSANGETTPWDRIDTCYDGQGMVKFRSYPYQISGATTAPNCTSGTGEIFTYDSLGHTTQVPAPPAHAPATPSETPPPPSRTPVRSSHPKYAPAISANSSCLLPCTTIRPPLPQSFQLCPMPKHRGAKSRRMSKTARWSLSPRLAQRRMTT
jgi:hypothetical protein